MEAKVVRYLARHDAVGANAELVAGVFDELARRSPAGVGYLCVRLGDEFIHVMVGDAAGVVSGDAFQRFSAGISERLVAEPSFDDGLIVGVFGFGSSDPSPR